MARQCETVAKLRQLLAAKARCIPVNGHYISVLHTPDQYFQHLLGGMAAAQQRLVVASLYAGTGGGREAQFLQGLREATARPGLQTHVLLDALRGTRPSAGPHGEASSSAAALAGMLGPGTGARVSLFHTPSLRGLLKRVLPPRVNEVIGVSHVKAYIWDDDVLMSGANLSSDYFTIRQDRYIAFRDCPALADWLCGLVEGLGDFSYQLQLGGGLAPPPAGVDPVRQPRRFQRGLRQRLLQLAQPPSAQGGARRWQAAWGGLRWAGVSLRRGMPQQQEGSAPAATLASTVLRGVGAMAEHALGGRSQQGNPREAAGTATRPEGADDTTPGTRPETGEGTSASEPAEAGPEADTWVFPLVQLGPVGVRQEEAATDALLRAAGQQPGARLALSSPYLNPSRPVRRALASAAQARVELLTASPAANGFFGAAGSAGFIPTAYQLLQRSTWRGLQRSWARRAPAAAATAGGAPKRLLEYGRPGWQYHAKGIWYVPPGAVLPVASVIGSSNHGWRSARRDLECQLVVVTANTRLQQQLGDELAALKRHCADAGEAQLQPQRPRVSYRAHLAARLMRSFL